MLLRNQSVLRISQMLTFWNMNMMNPLDQFVVRPLFGNFKWGINTFTLDTLLVAAVTFWVFYLLILSNKNLSHLYTYAIGPSLKTLSYGGVVGARRYRPLYVFVFVLIAMSNLMGMIPFSLTSTSFAVMTFFAGLTMFIGINIIALASYNWKFVNLFLPSGAPLVIAPFLIIIETISYFARVMSLSIRLFANLLAGHALMKIIGSFVWTTPLIAAALTNGLRPVADTRLGLAESFTVFTSQIVKLWDSVCFEMDDLVSKGNWWLFQNSNGNWALDLAPDVAASVIGAYCATLLIAFASAASLVAVTSHYFRDEISMPWTAAFNSQSILFAPVWMLYGLRAWTLSVVAKLTPSAFTAIRQPGFGGLVLFCWAALKDTVPALIYKLFSFVSRGTTMRDVSFGQIFSWKTYVAPIFSEAFWFGAVTVIMTFHFASILKFLGVTHMLGFGVSYSDVFTSSLWTFGLFGSGIILATILSVCAVFDFLSTCCLKAAPTLSGKVSNWWTDGNEKVNHFANDLVAVLVGLFAGWLQVKIYYTAFDVAATSVSTSGSLVLGAITRLGHLLPVYALVFGILVVIFHYIAEMVSASMNPAETRYHMKLIWSYGPAVVAGLILMELFYWALSVDIFCALHMETQILATMQAASMNLETYTTFDVYNAYRFLVANASVKFIANFNQVWDILMTHSGNPMLTILGAIGSALYVALAFAANVISTFVYYVVTEIDAILIAGLSTLMSLVALVTLPLMTPIAWSVLMAITFLEMFIALLQAYVFVTLSSMYLNDVIKLH